MISRARESRSSEPVALPGAIVLLTGARPWPRRPDGTGVCPVCHGHTPADTGYVACLHCNALSPRLTALVAYAALGMPDARAGEARRAERDAKRELARSHESVLPERERRRIWGGNRKPFGRVSARVANLAAVGRAWLTAIGQEPDFTKIIDRRGNVVGRVACVGGLEELAALEGVGA